MRVFHRGWRFTWSPRAARWAVVALGRIGALGGLGEIWRADDQVLGRAVAAKILPGRADLAKSIIGTAAYPAPEQVTTGAVSAATDVYALGVVANERLTGRRPFAAETPPAIALKHTHTEPLRDRAHPRPASNRS